MVYIPGGQGWVIERLVDSVGDLDFTMSWTRELLIRVESLIEVHCRVPLVAVWRVCVRLLADLVLYSPPLLQ